MQGPDLTNISLLRPLGQSRLINLAGGVVNFGINSSTRVIKGGLHLVDRSVGSSVNLTKSAIGLVRNSVNLGCDLAIGVVDVSKNLTTGVIKVNSINAIRSLEIRYKEISTKPCSDAPALFQNCFSTESNLTNTP